MSSLERQRWPELFLLVKIEALVEPALDVLLAVSAWGQTVLLRMKSPQWVDDVTRFDRH